MVCASRRPCDTISDIEPVVGFFQLLFLGFNLIQPSPHNGILWANVHILKICVAHRSYPTEALCFWVMLLLQPLWSWLDPGLMFCAYSTHNLIGWVMGLIPKHWQQQMFTLDSKYQSHEALTKFRILAIYFDHLTQQKPIRKLNFQFDIWH